MSERYFKLVGKKSWYFRVGGPTENGDQILKLYGYRKEFKAHKSEIERIINFYMTEYSLRYEILTKQEIESINLLYEY